MAEDEKTEGRAVSAPAPEPMTPADAPVAVATSGKAQVFSVAASAAGHLLVGLLIMGSLASAQKPPQIIPVKLIPADKVPDKPAPQTQTPQTQTPQKQAEQKPPVVPPPEASAAKTETGGAKQATAAKEMTASLGRADFGNQTKLPGTLLADLVARIKRCWTVPDGWSDPRQVTVTLRFQLRPDGTLEGDPAVVEFPATLMGVTAAKAALAAMKRCAPYQLPVAQYGQWKDVQLSLTP